MSYEQNLESLFIWMFVGYTRKYKESFKEYENFFENQ